MTKGIVADIERSSLHDGPGIRTVVFLKGCPLRCEWCHNPECIKKEPQTLFYSEKCIGCGKCEEGCFSGAKIICGKEMTTDEVMKMVLLDKSYYAEDGGLTISGGEPLMQGEFTLSLAKAAKEHGIHTAIETSLALYDSEVLSSFDLIMFDLKLPDDERHRKYTGIDAKIVKDNILKCSELGIPMLARTPVVIGVNADAETISEISDFLKKVPNVYKYELLPYHPLGTVKQKALGISVRKFEIPTKSLMEELNNYAFIR
ncbi:MAG: glycyl-radical enzyme activating protein [Clostridia bacterium]|nr:glycyl-radical enzyme activating protein [Clostridia bacterium]